MQKLTSSTDLAIAEIFGPTFQGEGPSLGRRAMFVRLAGCNLTCNYCDTPYTWVYSKRLAELHREGKVYNPPDEVHHMSVEEVVEALYGHTPNLIVITGGEPLLQRGPLAQLCSHLHYMGITQIEIETNGTQPPLSDAHVRYNVSPKLAFSGNPSPNTDILREYTKLYDKGGPIARFKFVVSNPEQLTEVYELVTAAGIYREQVWIMPEGTTPQSQVTALPLIADAVLGMGWNLTTRLHILAWPTSTRGK